MKILLTSTSFLDTPGKHQELLFCQGFEIDTLRGPVDEAVLLPIIDKYDAVICGDDEYTRKVIEIGKNGKLKLISKYGVGLDKVDLIAAKEFGIPVTNCPNVNQISVAEHVFALLLTSAKNIHLEYNITRKGEWFRYVGNEIFGKTIGIIGLGAIGKEVAKRASGFGLDVIVFDNCLDEDFIKNYNCKVASSLIELVEESDIISLHVPHNKNTEHIIDEKLISEHFKKGTILINTARGKLVDTDALKWGLDQNIIKAYLADVLEQEPMPKDYPMKDWDNVIITPHIGSRTFESVEKQGTMAVENLLKHFKLNTQH